MSAADEIREMGNAFFEKEKYKEAIDIYSDGLKEHPQDVKMWCNRSAAWGALHEYGKAEKDALRAIEIDPEWSRCYQRLGSALTGQKRYDDAIKAYEQALEKDPENKAAARELDKLKCAAKDAPELFDVHNLLNILAPSNIERLRSDPVLEPLIECHPEVHLILDAIKSDPASIEMYRDNELLKPVVERLLELWMKDTGMNPEDLDLPKTESEPSAEEVKNRGNQQFKSGNYEAALELYNRAISLENREPIFYSNKAWTLVKLNRIEEALEVSEQALRLAIDNKSEPDLIIKLHLRRAHMYEQMKDLEGQLNALQAALEIRYDPNTR